jgi:hypothetical protein
MGTDDGAGFDVGKELSTGIGVPLGMSLSVGMTFAVVTGLKGT